MYYIETCIISALRYFVLFDIKLNFIKSNVVVSSVRYNTKLKILVPKFFADNDRLSIALSERIYLNYCDKPEMLYKHKDIIKKSINDLILDDYILAISNIYYFYLRNFYYNYYLQCEVYVKGNEFLRGLLFSDLRFTRNAQKSNYLDKNFKDCDVEVLIRRCYTYRFNNTLILKNNITNIIIFMIFFFRFFFNYYIPMFMFRYINWTHSILKSSRFFDFEHMWLNFVFLRHSYSIMAIGEYLRNQAISYVRPLRMHIILDKSRDFNFPVISWYRRDFYVSSKLYSVSPNIPRALLVVNLSCRQPLSRSVYISDVPFAHLEGFLLFRKSNIFNFFLNKLILGDFFNKWFINLTFNLNYLVCVNYNYEHMLWKRVINYALFYAQIAEWVCSDEFYAYSDLSKVSENNFHTGIHLLFDDAWYRHWIDTSWGVYPGRARRKGPLEAPHYYKDKCVDLWYNSQI